MFNIATGHTIIITVTALLLWLRVIFVINEGRALSDQNNDFSITSTWYLRLKKYIEFNAVGSQFNARRRSSVLRINLYSIINNEVTAAPGSDILLKTSLPYSS